jgi:hypothetical protein
VASVFDYARWPSWAQYIVGLLVVFIAGTIFYFAWFQPAARALARFSPVGRKLLAASVAGMVLLILVWAWVNGHRS